MHPIKVPDHWSVESLSALGRKRLAHLYGKAVCFPIVPLNTLVPAHQRTERELAAVLHAYTVKLWRNEDPMLRRMWDAAYEAVLRKHGGKS